jgi:hypothetical protein
MPAKKAAKKKAGKRKATKRKASPRVPKGPKMQPQEDHGDFPQA